MNTVSQLRQLGLFDARVPRYTSYPPATQFKPSLDAATVDDWLTAIPAGTQISLYLHVPFCRRLCWFCACRTQGTQSIEPVHAYVETLLAELALLRKRLPPGISLSRLHLGGGTPTLLPPILIRRLINSVFDAFPLAPGGEFSVEIDPSEIDPPRMAALAAAGMNRASIGVQDFDPLIQKAIGRQQSLEATAAAVGLVRDHGIASLNADILYGLPHQTPTRIAATVNKLMALAPDRIALYGYAHVPWMARRQTMIPSDHLPTPQERLALFETARQLFVADGYDEIGIDHFALPSDGLSKALKAGKLRRNFQGYTDDLAEALVGMGASSISRFPQGYAQNASATSKHTGAIREGKFSTARGHVFSADDMMRARLIEALMCDFKVSTDELVRDYGAKPTELATMFAECAAKFEDMVRVTTSGLEIPEKGRPLTRMIARHFDAYDLSKAGHSSAI